MTQFVATWPSGETVRWRSLTWGEYRRFRELLRTRPFGISLKVYEVVKLEGPNLENLPAGICAFITESLMAENPFNGSYKDIDRAVNVCRQKLMGSYMLSARALVSHIFHYSFEEIDTWDADQFFQRLAMAEFITGKALDPGNPEETRDPKKKRKPVKPLNEAQSAVMERVRQKGRS